MLNINTSDLRLSIADKGYLSGELSINGTPFHVDMYEVRYKKGIWVPVNLDHSCRVGQIYDLNGDSLRAVEHKGKKYVVVVYPYSE
jgi:hypothetical protein